METEHKLNRAYGLAILSCKYQKSGTTVFLDVLRNILIIVASAFVVVLIGKWNWIVALIAGIPIYFIMLNLIGFVTLPLYYSLAPEVKLRNKIAKAFKDGDYENSIALADEYEKKFNVNVPEETKDLRYCEPE